MSDPSDKGDAFDQDLAALRRMAAELPRKSTPVRMKFRKRAATGTADELSVFVVGPRDALFTRTKVMGNVDLSTLHRWLAGAEIAAGVIAHSPAEEHAPPLTADEGSLLDEAGFTAKAASGLDALTRSRIDFEVLVRDSLDLARAARALGVSTGRLRQRLSSDKRTLFGFKEGRNWLVPRFQFEKRGKLVRGIGKLVRGIDKVVPEVPANANPLAVRRWFTTPHQDLVVGDDEHPVTPIAWLSSGLSPEAVAELAREI